MPGGFQLGYGAANFQSIGADLTNSVGTLLTAAGSANTKGSYSQLTSSLPYDLNGFLVTLGAQTSGSAGYLADIAIGAAASEINIITDLCSDNGVTGFFSLAAARVPISIPAGTRISARVQSSTASSTVKMSMIPYDGSFDGRSALGFATTYGADETKSLGTPVDAGGTANTKGSWVEISSSITYSIRALQVVFDGQKVASSTDTNWMVDIGIGGAGSEMVVIPNINCAATMGRSLISVRYPPLVACNIPAGTRIAARAQCQSNVLARRVIGVSLIGYS